MANYFENKEKLQQELQPYYREKTNLGRLDIWGDGLRVMH